MIPALTTLAGLVVLAVYMAAGLPPVVADVLRGRG